MSLWLVRAGKYGEHEAKFLEDGRIYLTWGGLEGVNLSKARDYDAIRTVMQKAFPDAPTRRLGNWAGQIWAFALGIQPGDWVVMPLKSQPAIAIGEVLGPYDYQPKAEESYRHSRAVKWLNAAVPRTAFDQDLLYSFGAFLTICEIKRNGAEQRVRAMAKTGWVKSSGPASKVDKAGPLTADDAADEQSIDLEQLARDSIARLIDQRFKGHGLARLVDGVLRAQGLTTHLSPDGPDKGIDILAAGGAFGFDAPRICVQVKSGDGPTDRPEFTQLIGAMQNVQATHGLFVSWGGFKPTVLREMPSKFFSVRLWNQTDLINQLLAHYDKLDSDIQAELPLKRVWTIAQPDE